MNEKLALFGGHKSLKKTPPFYNPIGEEEISAVNRVLQSGVLSDFIGANGVKFYGGEQVRGFEKSFAEYCGVKHAVSVNSLTSGLICAIGAIGVEPGDEVIVPPWTMSASATCILVWNAIPVFADIDEQSFNISLAAIKQKLSSRTRAIVVPSIFGNPAELDAIVAFAKQNKLYVIEDAAQAPGTIYKNHYVGTWGDIGGFSFNYHKHVHCGEGGICVTNDDRLAERMRLIRNHAEAVISDRKEGEDAAELVNMIGFNFRLGEMEAAIAREQLKKMDILVERRFELAQRLNRGLADLPGLHLPWPQADASHAYYVYGMRLENLPIAKARLIEALTAEGVPGLGARYVNIHMYAMYQRKIAYGSSGFPWSVAQHPELTDYSAGSCPVAEKLNRETYIGLALCQYDFTDGWIDQIISAFHKVWNNFEALSDE